MARSARAEFESLVAEHELGVLRLCRSVLRDEHLGADAAQEAFARLWTRLERGPAPAPAGPWLRRVALTASLDLRRRRGAREAAHERLAERALEREGERAIGAVEPGAALADAELRRRFEQALASLPEGQRTVFLLRHEAGIQLSEAAELLGLALPTVKTHFARACLKLQARLSAFHPSKEFNR